MTTHTHPSNHQPGTHWATDAAWEIMDTLPPGAISDDARYLIAGMIAGRLMKEWSDAVQNLAAELFNGERL